MRTNKKAETTSPTYGDGFRLPDHLPVLVHLDDLTPEARDREEDRIIARRQEFKMSQSIHKDDRGRSVPATAGAPVFVRGPVGQPSVHDGRRYRSHERDVRAASPRVAGDSGP